MDTDKFRALCANETSFAFHQTALTWTMFQVEKGKGGLIHIQGALVTKNPRVVSGAGFKQLGEDTGFVGAHWEVMKGGIEDSVKYVSKEGSGGRIPGYTLHEYGERPKGQGHRTDMDDVQERLINGTLAWPDLIYEEPMLHARYRAHWQALEASEMRKVYRTERPKCIWLWGASGQGKSWLLFNKYAKVGWLASGELYLFNPDTKWFDGFNPLRCKTFGMNEFRGQVPFSTLMTWADIWPCHGPVRCREDVPIKFDTLVITSIFHPKDVYKKTLEDEGEPWEQFNRRFEIIHVVRNALDHINKKTAK